MNQNIAIKIPQKLNILLVILIQVTVFGLLWLGSHLTLLWSIPIGIVFSFVLLTNYAIMHDATHHTLHKNKYVNYVLGAMSSTLFPQSFTLYEVAHQMHHQANRTDRETFDYYYPTDNMLIKRVQWYGILTGVWYPMVIAGTILAAISPVIFRLKIFSASVGSISLFGSFNGWVITKVRLEVLFAIIYWFAMYHVLSLQITTLVLYYVLFGINWSTRQYVTHAWTQRDVIEGALNLKTGRIMEAVLLNGNWDHVHHKHPYLPWSELANKKYHEASPVSYMAQYLSLWKGPRLNTEPSPEPILIYFDQTQDISYSTLDKNKRLLKSS